MSQALVLAGHGSQHHPGSAAPLHAHADRIRARGAFDEVRTAFWKEEPALHDVASIVESDLAVVVPVLTSEGYFADEVFPRELGVRERAGDGGPGDEPVVGEPVDGSASDGPEVRYAEPVGTHDAMTSVIEARVESTIEGPAASVGVALVGHGTERHARSADSTIEHARRLRDRGRYAEVDALFLDEAPHVGDLYDRMAAGELVVVPLFVADGGHTTEDVPAAIDHPGVGESAEVDGRLVRYAGAVGTEPSLADVIVERAVEVGATPDAGSSDRPTGAGSAFAEHVEAAPAAWIEWGELSVARRDDGFELRLRDDADVSRESLEALDGPGELRETTRTDDRGRYRPLSGARTLPTGWVLGQLDPAGLARAVEAVYPASLAHWWRGRNGELDVTGFRATVARQTGIYADLDGIDGRVLDATAEAVCGDCVRERRWEAGPDEEIGADPDEGSIPCREACPIFLSAAHAFEEAVEAGDVDPDEPANPAEPVGAFEEPGNEYRVRFARALSRRAEAGSGPVAAPTGGDR